MALGFLKSFPSNIMVSEVGIFSFSGSRKLKCVLSVW